MRLRTTLLLPELLPVGGTQDVQVNVLEKRFDPDLYKMKADRSESYFAGTLTCDYLEPSQTMLLCLKGVGHFLLRWDQILFFREPGVEDEKVRIYLLGTALGMWLQLGGNFPLHGSAVQYEGKALMFMGPSGVGKSTTAQSLMAKEFQLLADDVCLVKKNETGVFQVFAAYPQSKLWTDSADVLGIDTTGLDPVMQKTEKFRVPVRSRFATSPVPLRALIVLEEKATSKSVQLGPVRGVEKVQALLSNLYRGFGIDFLKKEHKAFKFCIELGNQIPVYRLIRPEGRTSDFKANLEAIHTLIFQLLDEKNKV
jgi:hypothetical protein